ncbi:putative LOV domain-containing protein [Cinnamomum micranthum f. kanehirae]|uniref:non-specific serine/threonine protein kinase n=1 Tax=Cinnamomum micranthum f. kanehirae TaxID=337451 RepID=A0A3S3MFH2_9MAGN|nr:putative LOV domain-containing protein [Cinnamomum micranthum f. kanehirae]
MDASKAEMQNPTEASFHASSSVKEPSSSRDQRQNIDVFNPMDYPSSNHQLMASSSSAPSHEGDQSQISSNRGETENMMSAHMSDNSSRTPSGREPLDKWMAFARDPGESETAMHSKQNLHGSSRNGKKFPESYEDGEVPLNNKTDKILSEASMAERAAEWGLIIKSEDGAGNMQSVRLKSSGEGGKISIDLMRTSEESNSGLESVFPRVSQELKDALATLQQTFVVSDATRPDCPIMFASAGFFSMTGYSINEGPDTDPLEIAKIREAVKTGNSYCGRLLNYKKDGTAFWNLLTISPIKDDTGKVIKYIGMQVEVSKYTEGLNEKVLRPNGLPKSLIRYDARQKEKAISSITEVVQTVKHPHSQIQTTDDDHVKPTDLEKFQLDSPLPKSAEFESLRTPGRQNPQRDGRNEVSRMSASHDDSKKSRKSGRISLMGAKGRAASFAGRYDPEPIAPEVLMTKDVQRSDSWNRLERERDIRQGIDLATTLERIEKNFVITDPRLPDNPIIFASDSFLELTEYSREEILGRNCRFLQGPDTDQGTVSKIRDAIREQKEITVQLINYTKSGKKFWNLFHLQPMRDEKGELQYFIGVQLDGSDHLEPLRNRLSENSEIESSKLVKATAENVDEAVRELPDANLRPEDLWAIHSKCVLPRPHKKHNSSWKAIRKVHRACIEREIISLLDHPFLLTLYTSFQTATHVCLITDFCAGGELFALLDKQPMKIFKEDAARFFAAEVVVGLEYLHCLGIIYRDLKPENILLQKDGHVVLTDFDLSFLTSCKPQVIKHAVPSKRRKSRSQPPPTFVAEPVTQSNSFVGTEEYIAPEIITGAGHSSAIDWWALGILLYEMLYGRTPFRGRNRQKTFANILHKDLTFPSSIPVSLTARQLIHGLLHRDPAGRLGSNGGANEIKQHPFFRGINWPLIRCMKWASELKMHTGMRKLCFLSLWTSFEDSLLLKELRLYRYFLAQKFWGGLSREKGSLRTRHKIMFSKEKQPLLR